MKWNSSSSLNNYESKFFLKGNTVFLLYFLYTQRFLSDISSQTVLTCWETQGCFFSSNLFFAKSLLCVRRILSASIAFSPVKRLFRDERMWAKKYGEQESGFSLLWVLNTWPKPEARKRKGLILVKETKKCNRNIKINLTSLGRCGRRVSFESTFFWTQSTPLWYFKVEA